MAKKLGWFLMKFYFLTKWYAIGNKKNTFFWEVIIWLLAMCLLTFDSLLFNSQLLIFWNFKNVMIMLIFPNFNVVELDAATPFQMINNIIVFMLQTILYLPCFFLNWIQRMIIWLSYHYLLVCNASTRDWHNKTFIVFLWTFLPDQLFVMVNMIY